MKDRIHWVVDENRFLVRRLDDESIILDLESGDYYTVSGSASLALRLVLGDVSSEAILKALKEDYPAVPERTLQTDLAAFLASLRARGIARPVSG